MTKEKYDNGLRYVAYDAANGDYAEFKTVEEAKDWLTDDDGDGISEEACNGQNWIAEKQYYSVVTKIEDKSDYCTCSDEYNDFCTNCNKELWPYSSDFDWIGKHDYERINWED